MRDCASDVSRSVHLTPTKNILRNVKMFERFPVVLRVCLSRYYESCRSDGSFCIDIIASAIVVLYVLQNVCDVLLHTKFCPVSRVYDLRCLNICHITLCAGL